MKLLSYCMLLLTTLQLSSEPLDLADVMKPQEIEEMGLSSLTEEQRVLLEKWLENWTKNVIEQAPTYRENTPLSQWIEKWPPLICPTHELSPKERIAEKKKLN